MKREDVDPKLLSPMMQQYMQIKDEYPDELLFYRLGDFYELFFEDALITSRELELTLTGKNAGLKERVPMCGVPFHSVKPYIEKIVSKGYKVAICEQLEDPKSTKGMVKRGVVQVISKGTVVDLEMLNAYENNYIGSILDFGYCYILTYADISTGSMQVMEIIHDDAKLLNVILNLELKEVILKENNNATLVDTLSHVYGIEVSISSEFLEDGYASLYEPLTDMKLISGVKHLLYYLVVKQLKDLSHIMNVTVVHMDDYLEMDVHTVRHLELVETMRLKERMYSLIWMLDKTKTAMGSRMLKEWLIHPLKNKSQIEKRYDMIEKLNQEFIVKDALRKDLYEVYDLERLCGKVACGNANARDLLQIKHSLEVLPSIKEHIAHLGFEYKLDAHESLCSLLDCALYENPPISVKEGYLIADGYNEALDELKKVRSGGKEYLSQLEQEEKERTGIKTLKVGYSKIFGYYIEVSKGQVHLIDDSFGWERRQTLTNCERYISPALKEKEEMILNAEEKIIELEYQLFLEVKDHVKDCIFGLKEVSRILSELDALCSLSVVSEEYNFVRPTITEKHEIRIIEGRHPVVEIVSGKEYVANDCLMDENINTLLITGPNMSGKSTYMRQLAIIIIMAQMGSFVPAKESTLPIIDKIFTRIGASDDLVSGESTFMVEMMEARNAIVGATKNSLILFDELGRGTATYDGMSLAQSILEYINKNIGCKTLFSTHYHEITSLEEEVKGIKNVHVSALEENGMITFLHKIQDGAVDKSYGIHVAKLAKMPDEVIKRADEILKHYEKGEKKKDSSGEQLLFDFSSEVKPSVVVEKLKTLDLYGMTPIDAMNTLYELKQEAEKE